MKRSILFLLLALVMGTTSCETQQKYNELKDSEERYYDEAKRYEQDLFNAKTKNDELTSELARAKSLKEKAEADTAHLSRELQRVQSECIGLQEESQKLIEKLQASKSEEEYTKLMTEINSLQDELVRREDALFKAERLLLDKQKELEIQNAKMVELTRTVEQQEQKMQEIKNLVKNALVGFEGNGLEIYNKNGRVYVSLDEQLLFQSGKWDVDSRGVSALNNLSNVLAQNKDINIVVEGHTDDVPYKGTGNIQDNWDLSVKRATSIVRILLRNNEINPTRITASGHGEFFPVETGRTPEARKKNRRTEIILTPNLDSLIKAFE